MRSPPATSVSLLARIRSLLFSIVLSDGKKPTNPTRELITLVQSSIDTSLINPSSLEKKVTWGNSLISSLFSSWTQAYLTVLNSLRIALKESILLPTDAPTSLNSSGWALKISKVCWPIEPLAPSNTTFYIL